MKTNSNAAQLQQLQQRLQELEEENASLRNSSTTIESCLARYTELYDLAPIAYFSIDRHGIIQQTNQAGAALLKLPYAQVSQKNILDFLHPYAYRNCNAFLSNVFSGARKDSCELELNVVHEETGSPKCFIHMTGFVDDSGKLCLATATDITKPKLAEKALQISEERWSYALDGAGDGVWDWDVLTGNVLYSKRQKEIWGGREEDIENRIEEFQKRIHPDDQATALKAMQDVLIGKTSAYVSEHRTLHQDGRWIWILARGMVVSRSTDGKPLRMVGTHTDLSNSKSLTEKMLLTEQLQKSHDLLAKLAEQVPGAFYQFKIDTEGHSSFPYISSGIHEMHEISPEHAMQDASLVYNTIHPDDLEAVTHSLIESAATLQSWRQEFRVILPRQGLRWRISVAQPEKLADGSVIWHGFTQGITKRKEIEQALRDSEYRWKFALEGSGDGVWDWDIQTNEVVLSKYWQDHYGIQTRKDSSAEAVEQEWRVRVHPDDTARVLADSLAHLEGKTTTYINRHRQLNRNGEYRWILSRGIVVSRDDKGQPLRMIGTHSDITPIIETEQRARELLQQNRSLMGRMFNLQEMERRHISRELHDELGQWLTAIQAEAEAIRGYTGHNREAKIQTSAKTIATSAAEVHELVRRMLRRLRPSLLDALGLEDSLYEMVGQWRQQHPETHCTLTTTGSLSGFSESLNITIYRIVQEMLTNIAKHAKAQQVSVELRSSIDENFETEDGIDGQLQLSVADDGIGMDPQAVSPGLGLLGIRERVLAAAGEYQITSQAGAGVRIDVKLPLNRQSAEDENNQEIGAYPVQPF